MKKPEVILYPIGYADESKIILDPALEDALDGVEEYSHLVVLFWMHKVKRGSRKIKKAVPYGFDDVDKKGVFATRLPSRPNPIGLSIVKLIGKRKNVLEVEGLDALPGSPILDIKPYTGHPKDLVYKFQAPKWAY